MVAEMRVEDHHEMESSVFIGKCEIVPKIQRRIHQLEFRRHSTKSLRQLKAEGHVIHFSKATHWKKLMTILQ